MKLVTFSVKGIEKIGVLTDKGVLDLRKAHQLCLSTGAPSWEEGEAVLSSMIDFLRQSETSIPSAKKALEFASREAEEAFLPLSDVELKAPIPRPPKVICTGLNYRDHAMELGYDIPDAPALFAKPPTTVIGPNEPIIRPKMSNALDYEVELAIVIGKGGRDLSPEAAEDRIAGYTIFNDVTCRDIQRYDRERSGQWFRSKAFDTFGPMGPCLVLKEQIPNPHTLPINLRVNGELRQSSNTSNMIFSVEQIVSFVSQVMTLEPGDVIPTGTPPGVGDSYKPEPKYLQPGDVVEAGITGIGRLTNPVE
ncbi:MAG: fumarylacetoacetate hydrolase family protein [Candidatus Bathyarchaeia archaeon]